MNEAAEAAQVEYHEELYSIYSDVFKSLNGIRPRWAYNMSIQELEDSLERLDAQIAWERDEEIRIIEADRIEVEELCASLNISEDTYKRWMADRNKFYEDEFYRDDDGKELHFEDDWYDFEVAA